MRLLIDARKLGHGGIGRYIENLVTGLLNSGRAPISLIVRSNAIIPSQWHDSVRIIKSDTPLYSLGELFGFPGEAVIKDHDLFHVSHYTLPFGIRIPTVVTIHDLIQVFYPERFFYPMIAKALIRSAVKRATRVIAVSEASADDLRKLLNADQKLTEKIDIVPNALNLKWQNSDQSSRDSIRKSPYILSICSLAKPHKGGEELITAYRALKAKTANLPELFIAGQGALALKEKVAGDLSSDGINFIGEVSDEQLLDLYRNARALIVPSRSEGFCLPMLEAQAVGLPVVTTPAPALIELKSSNDIVADGFSAAEIARAIERFLASPPTQINSDAVRSHLEKYSVERVTEGVLKVYDKALRS